MLEWLTMNLQWECYGDSLAVAGGLGSEPPKPLFSSRLPEAFSAFGSPANVKNKAMCWRRQVLNFSDPIFTQFRFCHKLSAALQNKVGKEEKKTSFFQQCQLEKLK